MSTTAVPTHTIPSRPLALAGALLTTILWSTTYVLVKLVIDDVGPLTLAAFRYFGGGLLLLPFVMRNGAAARLNLPRRTWLLMGLLGLLSFTLGNAAMFKSLDYLTATSVSFLNGFIPICVLIAAIFALREIPTAWQVLGVVIGIGGGVLFFSPGELVADPVGLLLAGSGVVFFSLSTLISRGLVRTGQIATIVLTTVPLVLGGGPLLLMALLLEGWPAFTPLALAATLWMTLVNTSVAHNIYNYAYRALTALEMNMLLNLMPLATALIAWLLLDERLTGWQAAGMAVMIAGVGLVQWGRRRPQRARPPAPPHRF